MLLDQVIRTAYGQFDIVWAPEGDVAGFDGDAGKVFAGQVNGWVGAANPCGVYVILARYGGGSPMRIELHDAPPPTEERWEDVVEVSVEIPPGRRPLWGAWAFQSYGDLALPAGSYRLRANASGRDAGRAGEFADGLVDDYLLQFWPAEREPDAVVRVGSADAAYWHRTWGSHTFSGPTSSPPEPRSRPVPKPGSPPPRPAGLASPAEEVLRRKLAGPDEPG